MQLIEPDAYWAHVSELRPDEYEIAVRTAARTKTHEQLGYYFAAIIPTAIREMQKAGNEYLYISGNRYEFTNKNMDVFLKECYATETGRRVVSKEAMSKGEASDYIEYCIRWCNERLGCQIPRPRKG